MEPGVKITLDCANCGKKFERIPWRIRGKHGHYCSTRCFKLARSTYLRDQPETLNAAFSITKICEWCKAEYQVHKPNHVSRRRFCSPKCSYAALHADMTGENNPNYRHGQNQRAAKQIAFRHFLPKCLICGWDISVDIHHIVPKKEGGKNEPTNLAVLCPNHHRMAEMGLISRTDLTQYVTAALLKKDTKTPLVHSFPT